MINGREIVKEKLIIPVKVESYIKEQAEAVLKKIGITMNQAIEMF